jgi:hypothetical protein
VVNCMLIDTEPIDAKGMVPLRRLVEQVENLPPEQLEAIADELCADQHAETAPARCGRHRHAEGARDQRRAINPTE